jgi:hypothetical protein
MANLNILIAVCLGYVAMLFAVAFMAERAALRGRGNWLRSPWIYTLSLSIYCTACDRGQSKGTIHNSAPRSGSRRAASIRRLWR